jgi:galactose mutarotase-like enzyme
MSAVKSTASSKTELAPINLANSHIAASFLPELGAKMRSLKSMASGREFLLQPPEHPYRRANYGASFADYDTSGFDDCCPTVAECLYPGDVFAGKKLPDHGDLWSASWESTVRDQQLLFEAEGKSLPYRFRKAVRLEANAAILEYEIVNTGAEGFAFLWAAHPLLAVESSCRIVLPREVSRLFVEWSRGERLGKFGDTCSWPVAVVKGGEEVDLSELGATNACAADKLFAARLSNGTCAVRYPQTKEAIVFHFDPRDLPYLGIWICQGGWPSPERGHFTVALEPCTGFPDSLREAMHRGSCDVLEPGQKKKWLLRIEISSEGAR